MASENYEAGIYPEDMLYPDDWKTERRPLPMFAAHREEAYLQILGLMRERGLSWDEAVRAVRQSIPMRQRGPLPPPDKKKKRKEPPAAMAGDGLLIGGGSEWDTPFLTHVGGYVGGRAPSKYRQCVIQCRQVRDTARAKRKASSQGNPWVDFVKNCGKQKGLKYREAMKNTACREEWAELKKSQGPRPKKKRLRSASAPQERKSESEFRFPLPKRRKPQKRAAGKSHAANPPGRAPSFEGLTASTHGVMQSGPLKGLPDWKEWTVTDLLPGGPLSGALTLNRIFRHVMNESGAEAPPLVGRSDMIAAIKEYYDLPLA